MLTEENIEQITKIIHVIETEKHAIDSLISKIEEIQWDAKELRFLFASKYLSDCLFELKYVINYDDHQKEKENQDYSE